VKVITNICAHIQNSVSWETDRAVHGREPLVFESLGTDFKIRAPNSASSLVQRYETCPSEEDRFSENPR
jgi:hypothetical protein